MYGRTVSSRTFMERSANHSTKGSRRGFVDVNTGVNPADIQTPAQQRDSILRRLEAVKRRREEIKSSKSSKQEYLQLGQDIRDLCLELSALKAKLNAPLKGKDFDYHFVGCARALLSALEYERIAEAARRRLFEVNSEGE